MQQWAFDRGVLWAMELNVPPPRVAPRIAAQIQELDTDAIPALVAAGSADSDTLARRFAGERRCFGVYVENTIAAYGWVSQRSEYIGEQEREFKIPNDEAYVWDCATLAPYRNQHLYSALLSHINHVLYQEHMRRTWIGAQEKNCASLHGFSNAGFHPILLTTYTRLLDLHAVWVAPWKNAPRELVTSFQRAWTADDQHVWGNLAWSWRGNVRHKR